MRQRFRVTKKGHMVSSDKGNGIIDLPSNHSVNETVEKLKGRLQAKGLCHSSARLALRHEQIHGSAARIAGGKLELVEPPSIK
jgi:hypothetical protein